MDLSDSVSIEDNRIHIYIVDIRELLSLDLYDRVSPSRRRRIDRYVKAEDKARCLASGLLERHVLGIEGEGDIVYGAYEKPYLKNGEVFYNLSHSGNLVVLSLSRRETGIDVEQITARHDDVAGLCFTPAERAESRRDEGETFFRIWTAKEALMKATGEGLNLPPESFTVLPLDGEAHSILGKKWFFVWKLFDGHIICTASTEMPPSVEYEHWDTQRLK